MIGPLSAMDLLLCLPFKGASNHPCHAVNADLWEVWCRAKGRDWRDASDVWSELDVASSAEMMLRQYIRNCVTGERTE